MTSHTETEHNRVQFQIDRVAFFSDAVIAIALTLMVLEIKIPEMGKDINFRQLINQYGVSLLIHALALMVGFLTIGNLWIQHHKLFEHIINYNEGLVRINLYFLLTIMLLPISISFLFAANEPQHLQLLFYFMNLTLCSFTYALMLQVIFNKKNHFYAIKDKQKINLIKINAFSGMLAFFIATILIVFNISWFYAAFLIIPLYKFIRLKKYKKHK